jgi:hypothetical protein
MQYLLSLFPRIYADKIKVNCAGKEIESKTSVTYLGVSLVQSLSGDLKSQIANKYIYFFIA